MKYKSEFKFGRHTLEHIQADNPLDVVKDEVKREIAKSLVKMIHVNDVKSENPGAVVLESEFIFIPDTDDRFKAIISKLDYLYNSGLSHNQRKQLMDICNLLGMDSEVIPEG